MPTTSGAELRFFDRFADVVARFVSRAPFFAACVALIVVWGPTLPLFGNVDTWQLALNSPTTAITFLLVALLQNTQHRADLAVQHKLNAIAKALADLMDDEGLDEDCAELEAAVGLEDREPS